MIISNQKFDEERALYGSQGVVLLNCAFDGVADGESALKESSNIGLLNCFCNLRYPFWHNKHLSIVNSEMTELCRAALWYSSNVNIENTKIHGVNLPHL